MPTQWDPLSLRRILGTNPTGLLRVLIIFVEDKPETPQCCTKGTADIFNTLIKQNLIGKNLICNNINNGQIVLRAIQQLALYEGHMEGLPVLIKHGLLNMISKVISQLSDKLMQNDGDQWDQIYEDVLETISSISDHSSKAKSKTIQTFGHVLLDILTAEKFRFGTRLEALKTLNLLLVHCPGHIRDEFSNSVPQTVDMSSLGQLLSTAGDYEFQVGLIEVLFRLTNKANRDGFATKWFRNSGIADAFLKIRDSEFETDCRIFLNELNKSGTTGVYTCPCVSVRLGVYEVKKPDDPKYTKFWVDFNAGSRRISLFCSQEPTESQQDEIDAGMWETVSLLEKDVRSYDHEEEHSQTHLKIFLHKNVRELISFGPCFEGDCVTISFPTNVLFHGPLQQTFGISTFSQLSQQSTQTASSKRHNRKVSKASVPSQNMQSQKSAYMKNAAGQYPQVSENSSAQEKTSLERQILQSPTVKKVKVSMPAEPMRTPRVNPQSVKTYPPLVMQPTPKRQTSMDTLPTETTEKALHPISATTSKVVQESEECVALPVNNNAEPERASRTEDLNLEEILTQNSDKVVPSSCPGEDTTTIPDSQARGIPLFPLMARSLAKQSSCNTDMSDDDEDDVDEEEDGDVWSTTKAHKKGKMAALKEYLTDNDPQYTKIPMNIHKVSNTPALSTVSEESSKMSLHDDKHTAPLDVIMENEEQCLKNEPRTTQRQHKGNQSKVRNNQKAARQPSQRSQGKRAAKENGEECDGEQPMPYTICDISKEHSSSNPTSIPGNKRKIRSVSEQSDARVITSNRKTRKPNKGDSKGLQTNVTSKVLQTTPSKNTRKKIKEQDGEVHQTSLGVTCRGADAIVTVPSKRSRKKIEEPNKEGLELNGHVTCNTIGELPSTLSKESLKNGELDYDAEKRSNMQAQKGKKSKLANQTRRGAVTSEIQGVTPRNRISSVQRSPVNHDEYNEVIIQTKASDNPKQKQKSSFHGSSNARKKSGQTSKQITAKKSPIKASSRPPKEAGGWKEVIQPVRSQEPKFFKARYRERLAKQSTMSPAQSGIIGEKPQKSKDTTCSKRNTGINISERSPAEDPTSQPIFSSVDSPTPVARKTSTRESNSNKSSLKPSSPTEIYDFEPINTAISMNTCKRFMEWENPDDIVRENEMRPKKTMETKSKCQKPLKVDKFKTVGLSAVCTGFDDEICSEQVPSDKTKVMDGNVKQLQKPTKRASIDPYTLEPCSSKPRTTAKRKQKSVFSETDDNTSVRSDLSWLGSTARKRKARTPLKAYHVKQPLESKHCMIGKDDCTDDERSEDDSKEDRKRQAALKKPRRKRKRKQVESPLITEDENSDGDLYYHKTSKRSAEINKENRKAKRSKRVPLEAEVKVLEVTPASKTKHQTSKTHGKYLRTLPTPNATDDTEHIEVMRFEECDATPYLVVDSPYMPSHVSLTSLEEKLTECKFADDFVTADTEVTWTFDGTSQISNATHISSLRTPKTPRYQEETEQSHSEDEQFAEKSTSIISRQEKERRNQRKSCTPHITPTMSIRKSKSEDADEDRLNIDEDSSSEIVKLSTSLQPRRLFEQTALYTVQDAESEEDESQNQKSKEEEELSEQNLEVESSGMDHLENENNDLQQNEQLDVGLDDTLRLLQSFNRDIEKNLLAKRKRLDTFSRTAIQSTHRKLTTIWQQQSASRHSIIEDFQKKFFEELSSLEREVSKIKETENQALHMFEKQYQVLQQCTSWHRSRVHRMKKLDTSLVRELQAVDNQPKSDKLSVKQTLKLEMQSLQRKIIQDSAQEELAHMRRNLQTLYY